MEELINKSELRRQLWERHDYIVSDYAMYADAEETADEISGVVSMLDDMPTVTEADVRAKAISEFAEKFIYKVHCEGCSGCTNCYETGTQDNCDTYRYYAEAVEELKAEQLKGE